jgi:hypothetical protein
MARKAGQLIARGQSTWLVRVYLRRGPQTETKEALRGLSNRLSGLLHILGFAVSHGERLTEKIDIAPPEMLDLYTSHRGTER